MKRPCKVSVLSCRRIPIGDWMQAGYSAERLEEEAEEAWEEILEEEGMEPFEESLYRDSWNEKKPLPPKDTAAETLLTAFGIFSLEEDGSRRISYEDSEITGLEGCLTTFCLASQNVLIMLRRGDVKTCMVFEKGARHLCDYGAEGGVPSVFLHTHSLDSRLTDEGGTVEVDYSVEIRGTVTERNRLLITVETQN